MPNQPNHESAINQAEYPKDLDQRGSRLENRRKVDAPIDAPLAENELTATVIKQGGEISQANAPPISSARLHMLDAHGCVTKDPTKCYLWTREQLGFGWWYASEYLP